MPRELPVKYGTWDVVRLATRTDRYRVYTYEVEPGNVRTIFVGQNSNTVTDERRDRVVAVIERENSALRR